MIPSEYVGVWLFLLCPYVDPVIDGWPVQGAANLMNHEIGWTMRFPYEVCSKQSRPRMEKITNLESFQNAHKRMH